MHLHIAMLCVSMVMVYGTAHMCFSLLTVCVKVTVETKHHVNSNVVLKRQCEMVDTTFSVWKLSVCNSGRQIACKSTFMMVLYFV